jgi:hypothetical protein
MPTHGSYMMISQQGASDQKSESSVSRVQLGSEGVSHQEGAQLPTVLGEVRPSG